MAPFIPVTDDFAVAPQITAAHLAQAKAEGFRLVINNRPDGEEAGQLTSAAAQEAAQAQGLAYVHIPIVGAPTPDQAKALAQAVADAGGPTLAYCRSGTRSISAWAMGQAMAGTAPSAILEKAARAGYELSGLARMLALLGAQR